MAATGTNDYTKVSTGKPKAGGAVFAAPAGTSVPTDASTELPAAFKCVGFISTDGITFSHSTTENSFKDWGGDEVYSENDGYSETCKFTMIETNEANMKLVWGDDAVVGGASSGVSSFARSAFNGEEHVLVVETVVHGGAVARDVIPRAKLTGVGDEVYSKGSLISYEATFRDLKDMALGYCSKKHFAQPASRAAEA